MPGLHECSTCHCRFETASDLLRHELGGCDSPPSNEWGESRAMRSRRHKEMNAARKKQHKASRQRAKLEQQTREKLRRKK